ncbi:hypothetical protein GGER_10270 [Serratia rubidaea]
MSHTTNKWSSIILVIGILFIAINLRVPFTAIAPVLESIRHDFGLSITAVGLLNSLPLLAFAAFSPLSASISRKYGLERTLFGALVVISAGILLRSTDSVWALYGGTVLIGIGIALGNVLLPGLIKRDFSGNVASVTGAYSITMGTAGAIGSTIVIPLTQSWGSNIALAMFVIAPLLAMLLWLPQLKKKHQLPVAGEKKQRPLRSGARLWRGRSPCLWA